MHPELSARAATTRSYAHHDLDSKIEEAQGLIRAIGLRVASTDIFNVPRINASTYIGAGQCDLIAAKIEEHKPEVVVVNAALSPGQQRNLEKVWNTKVIDRTGLILEIFGARAQTREGTLQVEMAALQYQRSRVVRSWTHLERQRGGAGFMGGPGEKQMELDRRILDEKIKSLKKALADVRRTRAIGRKDRERVPFPVIALVGYTNAGKSTLFNALTQAGVFAEDMPFATLDPTLRRLRLPGGTEAILSDTVGFISDLPTQLVEAFRATLEQINHADVIVHVMDVARPDSAAQHDDVAQILGDLGIAYETDARILEAWNKSDALDNEARDDYTRRAGFHPRAVLISAREGQGLDALLRRIEALITRDWQAMDLVIDAADGKTLAWVHAHARVLSQRTTDDGRTELQVLMSPVNVARWGKRS